MPEKRKITIYLSEKNCKLLENEKIQTGKYMSDTIDSLLDSYFKQSAMTKIAEMGRSQEDKLLQIIDLLKRNLLASNSNYRISNYIANLLNFGFDDIKNDQIGIKQVKASSVIKSEARKRAMADYRKLLVNELSREEFLNESDSKIEEQTKIEDNNKESNEDAPDVSNLTSFFNKG